MPKGSNNVHCQVSEEEKGKYSLVLLQNKDRHLFAIVVLCSNEFFEYTFLIDYQSIYYI